MTSESRLAAIPGIRQDRLIAATYVELRETLCGYIRKRIDSPCDAEDLVQDIFARLLEYNTLLDERTVVPFVYAIARNRVDDYLRRHARSRAAADYFFLHARRATCDVEERIAAAELTTMEHALCQRLPQCKEQIYTLCVHDGYPAEEVATMLNLSRRTVENHLFAARRQMRSALKDCI